MRIPSRFIVPAEARNAFQTALAEARRMAPERAVTDVFTTMLEKSSAHDVGPLLRKFPIALGKLRAYTPSDECAWDNVATLVAGCRPYLSGAFDALPAVIPAASTVERAIAVMGGITSQLGYLSTGVFENMETLVRELPLDDIPTLIRIIKEYCDDHAAWAIGNLPKALEALSRHEEREKRATLLASIAFKCGEHTHTAYFYLNEVLGAAHGYISNDDIVNICADITEHGHGSIAGILKGAAKLIDAVRGSLAPEQTTALVRGITQRCEHFAWCAFDLAPQLLAANRTVEEAVALVGNVYDVCDHSAREAFRVLPAIVKRMSDEEAARLLAYTTVAAHPYAQVAHTLLPELLELVPHARIPELFKRAVCAEPYGKPFVLKNMPDALRYTAGTIPAEGAIDDMTSVTHIMPGCVSHPETSKAVRRLPELFRLYPAVSTTAWWEDMLTTRGVDAARSILRMIEKLELLDPLSRSRVLNLPTLPQA